MSTCHVPDADQQIPALTRESKGKKGSSCQRQKTVQSATGLTIIATHPKGLALMTEDLQPEIIVNSTMNKSESTIGWGARPVFMIGWEAESIKSQIISWKRWPILWSLMKISCAELLNVDARYN
jgi:hypothetical protein